MHAHVQCPRADVDEHAATREAPLPARGPRLAIDAQDDLVLRLRLAAGGPTAGCNYRTHAGRTDPMCTIVGELQPPPIRPAAMLDMPGDGSGEEEVVDAADGVYDEPAPAPARRV